MHLFETAVLILLHKVLIAGLLTFGLICTVTGILTACGAFTKWDQHV